MAGRLFGTDGIRDVANRGALTPDRVLRLGQTVGRLFAKDRTAFRAPQAGRLLPHLRNGARVRRSAGPILVGRDPRRSGPLLERALSAGLLSAGADVCSVGVVPTPAVAFLTRKWRCDLGCVLSASHNPMSDNGIKFFAPEGLKIPDAAERAIEEAIARPVGEDPPGPVGCGIGTAAERAGGLEEYLADLAMQFPALSLRGMKVVLDCANGATSEAAPRLFQWFGAEVHALSASPDGVNINDRCGAVHPGRMAREVRRLGADVGLSFDGDGDRMIAADGSGRVVDGDVVLAIVARALKGRSALPGDTVVGTVMSNLGLELSLSKIGVRLARTAVGDRWVADACLDGGFVLGGEPSGHVIFFDRATTGDGLLTGLLLLSIVRESGSSLGRLSECIEKCPQVLRNVRVREKPPLERVAGYRSALAAAERALGDRGRILVRYSGTEPLVRVMVEGEEARAVSRIAGDLAGLLEKALAGRRRTSDC